MFYTLYKITNNINGNIYIGCHKTDNLDDGYFGSGKYLKRSINKYGIENFTKEIMYLCRSIEEMFNMESLLVDANFVKRKDTLNIREGGFGGWDHITSNSGLYIEMHKRLAKAAGDAHKERLLVDKDYREKLSRRMIIQMSGENNPNYGKPGIKSMLGKHHTEESKQKIGEANSKHQIGQGNSNYGKSWIYCPYTHESKSVPRYELKEWEDSGWVKGRKVHKK